MFLFQTYIVIVAYLIMDNLCECVIKKNFFGGFKLQLLYAEQSNSFLPQCVLHKA